MYFNGRRDKKLTRKFMVTYGSTEYHAADIIYEPGIGWYIVPVENNQGLPHIKVWMKNVKQQM